MARFAAPNAESRVVAAAVVGEGVAASVVGPVLLPSVGTGAMVTGGTVLDDAGIPSSR